MGWKWDWHFFGRLETIPQLFSEKYHTGMSQCQYGSQCVSDYLKTSAIQHYSTSMIFHSECTRNHLLAGPAGEAHGTAQTSPGFGKGTPRHGRHTKAVEGKARTKEVEEVGTCESFFCVRIESRIESAVRFNFESNFRIESVKCRRQLFTLYSEYLIHSIGIYFVFVTNESDARN